MIGYILGRGARYGRARKVRDHFGFLLRRTIFGKILNKISLRPRVI